MRRQPRERARHARLGRAVREAASRQVGRAALRASCPAPPAQPSHSHSNHLMWVSKTDKPDLVLSALRRASPESHRVLRAGRAGGRRQLLRRAAGQPRGGEPGPLPRHHGGNRAAVHGAQRGAARALLRPPCARVHAAPRCAQIVDSGALEEIEGARYISECCGRAPLATASPTPARLSARRGLRRHEVCSARRRPPRAAAALTSGARAALPEVSRRVCPPSAC